MEKARPRLTCTQTIPKPNEYVLAMKQELGGFAFNEEESVQFKGLWQEKVFEDSQPLDLEIGTGNGFFFAHQAKSQPERNLIGIERKFKPLVQSMRRVLRNGSSNARISRYDASFPEHLFAEDEIENVYIHFPDPWLKDRWHKNRIIQVHFLEKLIKLQKPGSFLEFKTDSLDYYLWARDIFENCPYDIEFETQDLHQSERAESNFTTHFEQIFLRKGQKINYALLRKP